MLNIFLIFLKPINFPQSQKHISGDHTPWWAWTDKMKGVGC